MFARTTTPHHTTLHPAGAGEVTTATTSKSTLQPPFGPSVDSLCHSFFTTTKLPDRFPIFKTSAATLLGTTYIYIYTYPRKWGERELFAWKPIPHISQSRQEQGGILSDRWFNICDWQVLFWCLCHRAVLWRDFLKLVIVCGMPQQPPTCKRAGTQQQCQGWQQRIRSGSSNCHARWRSSTGCDISAGTCVLHIEYVYI